jgi:carbamoyl-phosphate synthase large subunit
VQDRLRRQVTMMAKALNVVGLMNTQFAIQGEDIYILEVNPRASRTVPFVAKVTGVALAKIAARCMVGQTLEQQGALRESRFPSTTRSRKPIFPFVKFPGVDPILGPEMRSTGEVMGVGRNFGAAFARRRSWPPTSRRRRWARPSCRCVMPTSRASVPLARDLVSRGFRWSPPAAPATI